MMCLMTLFQFIFNTPVQIDLSDPNTISLCQSEYIYEIYQIYEIENSVTTATHQQTVKNVKNKKIVIKKNKNRIENNTIH